MRFISILYDNIEQYVRTESLKPILDSAIRFEDGFWNNMFHVGWEFKYSSQNEHSKEEADTSCDHMLELTSEYVTEAQFD